jgi:hypothetical protein
MNEQVSAAYCKEHGRMIDERFKRDKKDLQRHEEAINEIRDLTVEISTLVKQNNENLKNHENRITALEKKPSVWFDRIVSGITAAVVAAVVSAMLKGNVIF